MNSFQIFKQVDYLGISYRYTYHGFSNLIEWGVKVKLSWWKSLIRSDGRSYVWERIYMGHAEPIKICLETFGKSSKMDFGNGK